MGFLTSLRFVRNDNFVCGDGSVFGLKPENTSPYSVITVIPNGVRNLPNQPHQRRGRLGNMYS